MAATVRSISNKGLVDALEEERRKSSGDWPFAFALEMSERTVPSLREILALSSEGLKGSNSFAMIFLLGKKKTGREREGDDHASRTFLQHRKR